jgi:hypothetical protein
MGVLDLASEGRPIGASDFARGDQFAVLLERSWRRCLGKADERKGHDRRASAIAVTLR